MCSVAQLCLTLYDPMDCRLPVSSLHGNFQARILEQDLPDPGAEPVSLVSPALSDAFFTTMPPGNPLLLLYSFIKVVGIALAAAAAPLKIGGLVVNS